MLPDERSIGGRKEVEAELRNMHKKILNARSTLQTRLDRQYRTNRPRPASAKSLTDRREVRDRGRVRPTRPPPTRPGR